MNAGTTCGTGSRVQAATASNLVALGFYKSNPSNVAPDWGLIIGTKTDFCAGRNNLCFVIFTEKYDILKKNSNSLTLKKCVDRHDRILRSTGSAVGGSSDCLET